MTVELMEPRKVQGYGYRRDLVDFRDLFMAITDPMLHNLPDEVDLLETGWLPPVYDQGQLGSCTANSAAANMEYIASKHGLPAVTPSRLFIYWNERYIEHSVLEDSGATIRDAIKVTNRYGVCPESEWPYDISTFTTQPTPNCYADALKDRVVNYQRVPRVESYFKAVLAQKLPIQIGFSVYESFETTAVDDTGFVPLPEVTEKLLGGHAVLLTGYRVVNGRLWFKFRNSYGANWGDAGYGYLPSTYLLNKGLSSDFWAVDSSNATAA